MSNTDHTARPESWTFLATRDPALYPSPHIDCILELRARVERLEQAQQPIPRYNLRFRGVDLVPPIDCPDPMLWIAEQVYEQATASVICQHIVSTDEGTSYCGLAEQQAPVPAEPIDRMGMTLEELLRLNELWNAGEPGGRQLNLSGLDLSGADLSSTDLQGADLSNAYMRSANLTRANLRGANLHGASTRGAIGLPRPAPIKPAPSTPEAQGQLVNLVAELIAYFASTSRVGDDCTPVARRIIVAVVLWLESQAWRGAADALRREVKR
jgi:hypothetical protein